MTHKVKTLNIVTLVSIALYYGAAFFMCGFSFNDSSCTDVGIVIAPLAIPLLILVPATVIVDIMVLGRKVTPGHKRLVSAVILAVIATGIILAYVAFEHRQYYSPDKAIGLIRNCQVSEVSYKDSDGAVYFYPVSSINGRDQLKVHDSEHVRVLQTIKSSPVCKYSLQLQPDGFDATTY